MAYRSGTGLFALDRGLRGHLGPAETAEEVIGTTTAEEVPVSTPMDSRRDAPARVGEAWLPRAAVPALILSLAATTLAGWRLLDPLAVTGPGGSVPSAPWVPWWLLAAGFTASQAQVLNVQIRREARSVFLSEIPMVVGLLYTAAQPLILARVLGAAISFGLLLKQYRQPRKLAFNLVLAGAEAVAALAVLHLIAPWLGADPPQVWVAALVATAVSTGLAAVAVGLVIDLLDARVRVGELVLLGLRCTAEALPACVLGVVAAAAWSASRWSAIPVLLASSALLWAYRAYARLRERHLTLERLYQFSRGISLARGGNEVVTTVLEQSMELLHAEEAWLVFLPVGTDRTATTFTLRPPAAMATQVVTLAPEEDWLLDSLIEEGRPVLLARSSKASRDRRFLESRHLRDAILVPVPGETGAVAVLAVGDRQGDIRGFDPADVRLLELVANQVATALHNGRLVDQLRHESLHDSLTGLPNRAMLQRELSSRLAGPNARPLTVAILDLDSFKDVNDTLGHQQGDLLLQQVAERLRLIIGDPSTLIARLGGDEFAVVRPGGTREGAEFLGSLLLRSFRHPFPIDGLELTVGTSIGISIAPHHGSTAPMLLKRADLSMYEAKQHGSGVRVFDPSADRTSRSRLALVTHLAPGHRHRPDRGPPAARGGAGGRLAARCRGAGPVDAPRARAGRRRPSSSRWPSGPV